jgi:hypothetical protein
LDGEGFEKFIEVCRLGIINIWKVILVIEFGFNI